VNTFMIMSGWILLRMRSILDRSWRQPKYIFMFNSFSPRKSCRLWENVEKYVRTRQASYSI